MDYDVNYEYKMKVKLCRKYFENEFYDGQILRLSQNVIDKLYSIFESNIDATMLLDEMTSDVIPFEMFDDEF